MFVNMITHSQLLEIISYDPDSGLFTVRKATSVRPSGTVMNINCTRTMKSGRKVRSTNIWVSGVAMFTAARLAWFYMTGALPECEIDHSDNDGWNQKWDNLRKATRSQNQANTRRYKSNSSGRKCVFRSGKKTKPWRAQIQKDNHRISLGNFETKDAAHAAYMDVAKKLHGEYARAA